MSKITAAIKGVHGYVPEGVLTNHDLEQMVDTNDEWITSRTGIKQRHILREPGQATSDMAVEAVRALLTKTGTDASEIDLLICATVTGDMVFPDTANTIMSKVGADQGFGYDINAACSGFLFALTTGAKFIETGTYQKVVVVGADMMSSIVNYEDRTTCIIFGDGAGAVLLEPSTEGHGVQDSVFRGDGEGRNYLHMKAGGSLRAASHETVDAGDHYVFQDGRPVFKAAVSGMVSTVKEVCARNDMDVQDIDWLVPHQANKRIIKSVGDMLDFPADKVMVNIENYGNTTAATLPLCLWNYEDQLKSGDRIVLTAFGGGFTWGSTLLTWGS